MYAQRKCRENLHDDHYMLTAHISHEKKGIEVKQRAYCAVSGTSANHNVLVFSILEFRVIRRTKFHPSIVEEEGNKLRLVMTWWCR